MKKNISDIADIHIGYQFRTKIEPAENGSHRVIQIRDFDENRFLHPDRLLRVNIENLSGQYTVKRGDVLFLSRGQHNWAVSIEDDLRDTIAVSHFFIIKTRNGNILPGYLAWYINQPTAQEIIHSLARRGTHMPLIPLSVFKKMTIEIPDMQTQRNIAELNRLMEIETRLMNELRIKRSQLINKISMTAVAGKEK